MGGVMQVKRCSKCGEVKPTTRFHHNRRKPDGLSTWCAACNCKAHKRYRVLGPRTTDRQPLSPRAREVLTLLSQGKTYAETALVMGVTRHTVSSHVQAACRQLRVNTILQAMYVVGVNGLIRG